MGGAGFADADVAADAKAMGLAISTASPVAIRRAASPNPAVGAVVITADGHTFAGVTEAFGGAHGEIMAMRAARIGGAELAGSTVYTTLEPCNHQGRTGPCTEALIAAGVSRVVIGLLDPDPLVSGTGVSRLRSAGLVVDVGTCADEVANQLEYYLYHRTHGRRPFVTLKLAASLDGRTAAPDGSSQWITGDEAQADTHRLRAEHDAILVGAGTVRADNPTLTVRHVDGPDPRRFVLGAVAAGAAILPAESLSGPLDDVLDELGRHDVLSVLVEGGATVAHAFHTAGLVNRYVMYLAPAMFGGDDALGIFRGVGSPTMAALWRGTFRSVDRLGNDLRLVIDAPPPLP
jgi:diaminohydroxyphosphoribosylaminopyrimidine deaminase / 5-amino-6-(5-phosphoribosylamino)uracil reductase